MKYIIYSILLTFLFSKNGFCQTWTKKQIDLANTAKNITYLTKVEKETILYINLARLFPKEFAEKEILNFNWSIDYGDSVLNAFENSKKSLIVELFKRKKCKELQFDKALYLDAKCYSKEISKEDRNGHERKICNQGIYAECVSFGSDKGKDIAIDLLIDFGVESLGHRLICLDNSYKKIGVSFSTHFKTDFCAVLEFK